LGDGLGMPCWTVLEIRVRGSGSSSVSESHDAEIIICHSSLREATQGFVVKQPRSIQISGSKYPCYDIATRTSNKVDSGVSTMHETSILHIYCHLYLLRS
jgi:hypothetical protein